MNDSRPNRSLEYIDAMRGLAVLAVVMVHSTQSIRPASENISRIMSEGATGVQLFYIASAFTLSMSWNLRKDAETSPIRNFFLRRLFRIAPMFWIACIAYTATNGLAPSYWAPNGISWYFIPVTALFVHGFHPETINSVVPGSWSIAVEMTYYLLLPFLLTRFTSQSKLLLLLVISAILYGANKIITPHIFSYPESRQYLVGSFVFFNFLGQFPVFIIGMMIYRLIQRHHQKSGVVLMIAGSLLLLSLEEFWNRRTRIPHHFVAGIAFALFCFMLSIFPLRIFVNKFTVLLGKLSFCIYLSHFLLIAVMKNAGLTAIIPHSNIGSLAHFALVVAAATVVSYVLHIAVEVPAISLGARSIARLEAAHHH